MSWEEIDFAAIGKHSEMVVDVGNGAQCILHSRYYRHKGEHGALVDSHSCKMKVDAEEAGSCREADDGDNHVEEGHHMGCAVGRHKVGTVNILEELYHIQVMVCTDRPYGGEGRGGENVERIHLGLELLPWEKVGGPFFSRSLVNRGPL